MINRRSNSLMRGWIDAAISSSKFTGKTRAIQTLMELGVSIPVIRRVFG